MNSNVDRKISVLIVDDEPIARAGIIALLEEEEVIERIEQCGSGEEAITHVRRTRPDLVFLDVQMPGYDGFDVIEILGSDMPPAVIFVTAFDQHALRAFEAGALDYLLKPFNNTRFWRAFERAKVQILHGNCGGTESPRKVERLLVKSLGRAHFVNVSDIEWVEAADYYACLHVGTQAYLVRRTMGELEADLNSDIFCRIHRSTIINVHYVAEIRVDHDGEHKVTLFNGKCLRTTRRHYKSLKSKLDQIAKRI